MLEISICLEKSSIGLDYSLIPVNHVHVLTMWNMNKICFNQIKNVLWQRLPRGHLQISIYTCMLIFKITPPCEHAVDTVVGVWQGSQWPPSPPGGPELPAQTHAGPHERPGPRTGHPDKHEISMLKFMKSKGMLSVKACQLEHNICRPKSFRKWS